MESKNTAACHCEEDLKTPNEPIEESSKPENYRSEFVFNGSTTHVGWNERESTPDVQDSIKMYSKILGSKSCLCSVAIVFGALIMMSMIPGAFASGKCVGNSDHCLSLARNGTKWFDDGTKWFDEKNDCKNVRCLHLSEGQHDLLQFFPNVEELFMDDMGSITIPCYVLKNLSNLHKVDLHVKNIFPTFVCNTSCVLSEVTVAVLRSTSAITCNLFEWMPKLKNVSFKNDQAPTSVSTEMTSEDVFTTPGNMVNQEKDAGFSVGVVFVVVAFGVGIVVGILLDRYKNDKIESSDRSPAPVPDGVTINMFDQGESESEV